MKCEKSAKNAHLNFPEQMLRLQIVSFVQTAQKHKDSSFIFINETEKQEIFTFKTLNQQQFSSFYLKIGWNDSSIIKNVAVNFLN